jgi:hypothetical protein
MPLINTTSDNFESIVRTSGRIRDTQSMRNQIKQSFDKKVTQVSDTFDIDLIQSHLKMKAGFDKTISHELLTNVLVAIQATHEGSIQDFDCVIILYENLPIYCFINSSKFRVLEVRKEIEEHRKRIRNSKNQSDNQKQSLDTEFGLDWNDLFYVPQLLADMDDMLAGVKDSMFHKLCALNRNEYSYCLDLNHTIQQEQSINHQLHHLASNRTLLSYIGLATGVGVAIGSIGFYGLTHLCKSVGK